MRSLFHILRQPVPTDARALLQEKWNELDPQFRTDRQIYGRNEEGCGGTVGAMPKCDFACRGCYLTHQANRVPEMPLPDVKRQLDRLRAYLGPGGNLQLTDGELTLRDESELIQLIRYARTIGLIPMLMTHGDTIRQDPGLLERLMILGGLDEISFHIDTTQRGRIGFRHAAFERELNPLRVEFAEIVRAVRKKTGLPIRVASTITVGQAAVEQIPEILDCMMEHADVYRMISFLPLAQVGRTETGLGGGVSIEDLWDQVSTSLGIDAKAWHWHMGHPSCNRFLMGMRVENSHGPPAYLPLSMAASPDDNRFMREFFAVFGGITFRADRGAEKFARAIGMILRAPRLMTLGSIAYGWRLLRRVDSGPRIRTLWRCATGRIRFHRLTIASHHFMSRTEVESPLGRERIDHCVFKVADGGRMVSMCEFNTLGGRDRLYQRLREEETLATEDVENELCPV